MCGIYGYVYYGNRNASNEMTQNYRLSTLLKNLGSSAASRGTHATGVAGFRKPTEGEKIVTNDIKVKKDGISAWQFDFKAMSGCDVVMGHTRHATHGSPKHNYNNHPFVGRDASGGIFAFAHNGVIDDDGLRATYKLPKPVKIETDSFAFCQLLEGKDVSFKSFKEYAPSVEGSFVFTFLNSDGIWIVKGDNPIAIVNFKRLNLMVYASTEEILLEALGSTPFTAEEIFGAFSNSSLVEVINTSEGDLINIDPKGVISKDKFEFNSWLKYYHGKYSWDDYSDATNSGSSTTTTTTTTTTNTSLTTVANGGKSLEEEIAVDHEFDQLCTHLSEYGYEMWELQMLVMEGFSLADIEECFNTNCLAAIVVEYCHGDVQDNSRDASSDDSEDVNSQVIDEINRSTV